MLKIAYHSLFAHPLPIGHRFPMEKYNLLPQQLIYEGTVKKINFFEPQTLANEIPLLTHDASYIKNLHQLIISKQEEQKIGFPLSKQLITREFTIAQGTCECALYALANGISFNIAGGTHHAFSNRGEGFCMLNDQAIAANYLLHKKLARKIVIIDLDVHQGNGTAKLFESNKQVFTFSMHGAKNYPLQKEKSDLDIGLPDKTDDKAYLNLLYDNLDKIIAVEKPDFIFHQAGVDIINTDKLGRLSVSIAGCKQRDFYVLNKAYQNKIPIVVCMGGGYSEKIATIVEAHANTYRVAQHIYF